MLRLLIIVLPCFFLYDTIRCSFSGADLKACNADGLIPYDICDDEKTSDFLQSQMHKFGKYMFISKTGLQSNYLSYRTVIKIWKNYQELIVYIYLCIHGAILKLKFTSSRSYSYLGSVNLRMSCLVNIRFNLSLLFHMGSFPSFLHLDLKLMVQSVPRIWSANRFWTDSSLNLSFVRTILRINIQYSGSSRTRALFIKLRDSS